jgi:hypothetical protein
LDLTGPASAEREVSNGSTPPPREGGLTDLAPALDKEEDADAEADVDAESAAPAPAPTPAFSRLDEGMGGESGDRSRTARVDSR